MPVRPARQTIQSTLPYGVGYAAGALPRLRKPTFAGAAGAGRSLAAARPCGYQDGAEDATTLPPSATRSGYPPQVLAPRCSGRFSPPRPPARARVVHIPTVPPLPDRGRRVVITCPGGGPGRRRTGPGRAGAAGVITVMAAAAVLAAAC